MSRFPFTLKIKVLEFSASASNLRCLCPGLEVRRLGGCLKTICKIDNSERSEIKNGSPSASEGLYLHDSVFACFTPARRKNIYRQIYVAKPQRTEVTCRVPLKAKQLRVARFSQQQHDNFRLLHLLVKGSKRNQSVQSFICAASFLWVPLQDISRPSHFPRH